MKRANNKDFASLQLSLNLFSDPTPMPAPPAPKLVLVQAVQDTITPPAPVKLFAITSQLNDMGDRVAKCRNNLTAIELAQTIRAENRQATDAERDQLVRFCGWGGIPHVFAPGQYSVEQDRLKALLSPEQFEQARASTLNAHYTSPEVVNFVWSLVQKMGFTGGKVLEPSAGIGHFIGRMPEAIRRNSNVQAVEPDPTSASILSLLYPEVAVFESGVEKAPLRKDHYDLVISNVPFGNYRVSDVAFNKMKLSIHDYFFAKAMSLVRPGGLVAFITSSYTMDKSSKKLREYLTQNADLIAAYRLPNGTFAKMAETDVCTDLIILKRPGAVQTQGCEWTNLGQVPRHMLTPACNFASIPCNDYYVKHPDHVLGKFSMRTNGRYGEAEISVKAQKPLNEYFGPLLEQAPANIWEPASAQPSATRQSTDARLNCGYEMVNGQLVERDPFDGVRTVEGIASTTMARIIGMVQIRDTARQLIDAESQGCDGSLLRRTLNTQYDQFVADYGPLSNPHNRRLMATDSGRPLLLSLEFFDDESSEVSKATLFFKTTVSGAKLAEQADSISDAIALSYNHFGRINPAFMAQALGVEQESLQQSLLDQGLAFVDPADQSLVEASQYLSGNVRQKLALARAYAKSKPDYLRNVQALEEVMPRQVPYQSIHLALGAPWLPVNIVEQFVDHLTEKEGSCKVTHNEQQALWLVAPQIYKRAPMMTSALGTERRPFFDLLEDALNQQWPTVYDEVDTYDETGKKSVKRVVNTVETTAARDKIERIHEAFANWVFSDEVRALELEERYNDLYNSIVNRQYDGSHMIVPGLNPNIQLRDAQKDTIWRNLVNGNALNALAVGGGKTLIQIVTAHEAKRLGIAAKPTLIVPNHMLDAFTAEYMRAFPSANVLAASKEDLTGEKRRTMMMRMASGDWDSIIITHASFGKLQLAASAIKSYIKDQMTKIAQSIEQVKAGDVDVRAVKIMEGAKRRLQGKLESMLARSEKDENILTFDQLGIDMLLVDEADLFKNLYFNTKKTRVAGLPQTNSMRAMDMFLKSRVVFEKRGHDGHGLIFSTATPIANTVAEMFIMQLYLQERLLREHMIDQFDAWAANYGREVTSVEVAPDGSGYRMHTRFCRFENVPELMRLFRETAEIRTKKMLALPEPELAGGKHQIVAVPASDLLREYVATLVERAEAIRNGEVKPNVDNMLCVTSDGRKAALDMRLIAPGMAEEPGNKVNACIKKVYEIWENGKQDRLTQLVFCDLSTPSNKDFSVYRAIRDKWLKMGVPEAEIAFAQDYNTDRQKAELHRLVRAGKIRILLGSTELMGFGTNVQDLLVAEHHLDAPWRPRDVEQRDGRIIRQGNRNRMVWIYRYVTENSFDAYMWQTLETKAKFIAQVMENDGDVRAVEDVTSQALSYAEVKALASGNPLVIEKAGIDAEVAKLAQLRHAHAKGKQELQWKLRSEQQYMDSKLRRIEQEVIDGDRVREHASTAVQVDGLSYNDHDQASKIVLAKAAINEMKAASSKDYGSQWPVCSYKGLDVVFQTTWNQPAMALISPVTKTSYPIGRFVTESGVMTVLDNAIERVLQAPKESQKIVQQTAQQIKAIEHELAKPFEYESRWEAAQKRQADIDRALGLMDNEAGTTAMESEENA